MKNLNRRQFLKGSGLVTLAGIGGVQVGFGSSLLNGTGANEKELLVYVFLEGGMDGLNFVPPRSGADYTQYSSVLRPTLHIPNNQSLALNGDPAFGFHPLATGMRNLYNQDKMAVVHATGMLQANRSHFETINNMELGRQNTDTNLQTGWVTRYFNSSLSTPEDALLPVVVPSYVMTNSVLGDASALVMSSPLGFSLESGHWTWESSVQPILTQLYESPETDEEIVGYQTLNASQIIQGIDWDNYTPGNNAEYPLAYIGDQLKTVAQLFKSHVDLEVAYVRVGSWDTHTNQGTGTDGAFAELVQPLSDGLEAFYQDLAATHAGKFTVIVQSEFGRRSYENESGGTDHGYGNPMFIIGDNINPGFHGEFPGLQDSELFQGDDVDVTVDYRDVVCEVLMKRMKNRFLGHIFPGYTDYTPLGVINGDDLVPIYDFEYDGIFKSGFD